MYDLNKVDTLLRLMVLNIVINLNTANCMKYK